MSNNFPWKRTKDEPPKADNLIGWCSETKVWFDCMYTTEGKWIIFEGERDIEMNIIPDFWMQIEGPNEDR